MDSSLLLYGAIIMMSNLGAKYIQADLHEGFDRIGYHPAVRKLIILGLIYATVRDLPQSLLILLIYMIIRRSLSDHDPDRI